MTSRGSSLLGRAQQLKAALRSTAGDDDYTVCQQGAGRLDIARADRQQVFATTTPNLNFGRVEVEDRRPATSRSPWPRTNRS